MFNNFTHSKVHENFTKPSSRIEDYFKNTFLRWLSVSEELREIEITLEYIRLIHHPSHTPQDLHEIELMYCLAGEPDILQAGQ